jgi:hypothetical protein
MTRKNFENVYHDGLFDDVVHATVHATVLSSVYSQVSSRCQLLLGGLALYYKPEDRNCQMIL